ncbi:aldehyde dehydrogenase family protein [Sesbania bispinosa]|nr:aldehyde dehydrogenase family protein [Sesbania bispinosa]
MSTSSSRVGVKGPLLELAQNGIDQEEERIHNCSSYELGYAIAFYFNIINSHPKRL